MKYPLGCVMAMIMAVSPAYGQEVSSGSEQKQSETVLNFTDSLMFRKDAMEKFLELYGIYKERLASGQGMGTFTDTSLNLDITSEEEDMEHPVLSLNSVLWDKGKWTIWVNGRKYEMDKINQPIIAGGGQFSIISVGKDTVSFTYYPSAVLRQIEFTRYQNRDMYESEWKRLLVKGEGVLALDAGESYAFTLRPNQHFRGEYMILTEGAGTLMRPKDVEEGEKEGAVDNSGVIATGVGDGAVSSSSSAASGTPSEPARPVMPEWDTEETSDEAQEQGNNGRRANGNAFRNNFR